MKGTNLGEFEELVLLMVANFNEDAYGLSIRDQILKSCNRKVSLSALHSTLHRLEKKLFLTSGYDNTSLSERGGRPKLIFKLTAAGYNTLSETREQREKLWSSIPEVKIINK